MSLVVFGGGPFVFKDARRYFLALTCFLYVFTSGWIFYHFTGVMLADLPLICLLAANVLSGRRVRFFVKPIGVAMLGLVLAGLVSATGAREPGWAVAESTKYLRMYLVAVAMVANLKTTDDLRFAIHWMLIGTLIQSLIGIHQWQRGAVGIWFLGERPASRVDWRSLGTFYVPAFFANYLSMTLCVAFRLFLFYNPPKPRTALFYGAVCMLGTIAIYSTYARAPWISFLGATVLVSLFSAFHGRFKMRSRWAFPVMAVFLLAFGLRYSGKIAEQFGSGRSASQESRRPQRAIARRMIAAHPLTGVGVGNYELHPWEFMTHAERTHYLAPVYACLVHNSYLLFTAEMGYPGGAVFIILFVVIFFTCAKIVFSPVNHPLIVNVALGIGAGIFSMVVFLYNSPDIHEYSILYQLGLYGGMLMAMANMISRAKAKLLHQQRLRSRPPSATPRTIGT
jgi:O-antigen ligase